MYFLFIPVLTTLVLGIIWCERNAYRGGTAINKEALEKKRRKNKDPGYPCGWFRIADVDEVLFRKPIERSVCGKDYIITKSGKGNISVFEPYCPHNGTDLGKSSFIRGDSIVCRFHEWEFDCGTGDCVKIPYGNDDSIMCHAGLKGPETLIWKNCILIWHHPAGNKSTWKPDEISENLKAFKFLGNIDHNLVCLVDDIHENSADLAHFQFLHKSSIIPFLTNEWENYNWEPRGHIGSGKIDYFFRFFQWKWLFSSVEWYNIGPGLILADAQFPAIGRLILVDTTTPREVFHTERSISIYGSKRISRTLFRLGCWLLFGITLQDNNIWNWKKAPQSPLYTKDEHELTRFRRWFRKFYQMKVEYESDKKE